MAAAVGTVCMALGITLTRAWGPTAGVSGLASTGWQLLLGGLMIAPLVPLVDRAPMAMGTGAVLGYAWLSLAGGALAYALWFHAARQLPATSTSLLGPLSPVTAALLGWALLGEGLSTAQTLGFLLALTASVLGQRRTPATRPGKNQASPPEPAANLTGGSRVRWY